MFETTPPLLRMTGISKCFGRAKVLQDAQFELRAGEVHVLAGENGAGKSTLVKILGGAYQDFEGQIKISGRDFRPHNPLQAGAFGISLIHQELSLIGPMSVADNIFLGRNLTHAGFVRDSQQKLEASRWLHKLGLDLDVSRPVEQFPIATRQLIEIAKALSQNARILVMDEPTSALSAPEVERLFTLIKSFKQEGRGILYITHKMEEIQRIADRVTVLRDGRWIGSAAAKDLPESRLIQWMVGREMEANSLQPASNPGRELLRLQNFSVFPSSLRAKPAVQNISLTVRAGEILGIGGLQGSGASELLMGLFGGYGRRTAGAVFLDDCQIGSISPQQAIQSGMALLTNDRKETGLVSSMSGLANITLASLRELASITWRRPGREREASVKMAKLLKLPLAHLDAEAGMLSGGNQQKVVIAKWLLTRPKILLLDDPTRGVDIVAKNEIYQLLKQWAAQGMAILLISSELPELLSLSDRIIVMHRGQITGEFSKAQATAANILAAAMGEIQVGSTAEPLFELKPITDGSTNCVEPV